MEKKIAYRLYLEPYTFIFTGEERFTVYNSINGYYLEVVDEVCKSLLAELQIPENGYCISVTEQQAKDKDVISFIHRIQNSFSGDIIPFDSTKHHPNKKPFIVPPILRLYNTVETIKAGGGQELGEVILRNLNEVTLFLPGSCDKKCKGCLGYYKQFNHCSSFEEKDTLNHKEYQKLFNNLDACGVNKVNLIVNDFDNPVFLEIWKNRSSNTFKKKFIFNVQNLSKEVVSLFSDTDELNVYVNNSFSTDKLNELKELTRGLNIQWIYIIESEKDIEGIDFTENTSAVSFYNKQNLPFFEENIYLTLEDLLESPIEKQTIFRRQALNENFFGKLFILPSGETFSNLNKDSLGNIKIDSLGQLIYNEFDNSRAWLLTRDSVDVCSNCQNKYLCPSISNNGLVIGKPNLCHIQP